MYIRVNTILKARGYSGADEVMCVKVCNPYGKVTQGGTLLVRVLSLSKKQYPGKLRVEVGKVYKALVITKRERFLVRENVYQNVYNYYVIIRSLIPVEDWS
uniref:Ribosomal protein L14 n=1 Tax=Ulnaria acus TaxID=1436140 RepID=D2JP79_9STRA|nr:hypothetical protein Sacm_p12 [Ulnaria acus]ACX62008.1 hypothetical protein [Ulnaria acus]